MLKQQKIAMIVILPANFEEIIQAVKNETYQGGPVMIELQCFNIHEDYLKNIYFCFERKLAAYYENVFPKEIELKYQYHHA
ncbi:MAG: hypothetical protein ACTSXP_18585 [Promethearchaeota archaeon]